MTIFNVSVNKKIERGGYFIVSASGAKNAKPCQEMQTRAASQSLVPPNSHPKVSHTTAVHLLEHCLITDHKGPRGAMDLPAHRNPRPLEC